MRKFWEDLDELVREVPLTERLFVGGDFNGHNGSSRDGYNNMHGGFAYGARNSKGVSLLEFSVASDSVIANPCFDKRDDHLVTFRSAAAKTQIFLLRRRDQSLCKDCKAIPSEFPATQHRPTSYGYGD